MNPNSRSLGEIRSSETTDSQPPAVDSKPVGIEHVYPSGPNASTSVTTQPSASYVLATAQGYRTKESHWTVPRSCSAMPSTYELQLLMQGSTRPEHHSTSHSNYIINAEHHSEGHVDDVADCLSSMKLEPEDSNNAAKSDRHSTFGSMSSSLTELDGVGFAHRPSLRHGRTASELSSKSDEIYADTTRRTRRQTLDAFYKLGDISDAAEYERLEPERRARELATPAELGGVGFQRRTLDVSRFTDGVPLPSDLPRSKKIADIESSGVEESLSDTVEESKSTSNVRKVSSSLSSGSDGACLGRANMDQLITPALAKMKEQLLGSTLGFCHSVGLVKTEFKQCPNAQEGSSSQSTGGTNLRSSSTGQEGSPSSHSRGWSQGGSRQEENGQDDDEGKKRPNKKRKFGSDPTAEVGEKFACPYFKRRPYDYRNQRACTGPGFCSVHRLKYVITSLL
jgi:hypothetical protein